MGEIVAFPKNAMQEKLVSSTPQGEGVTPIGAPIGGFDSKESGPVAFKVSVDTKSMTMPVPVAQWIAMSQALAFYASQGFDHGARAREALGLIVAAHDAKEERN